MDFFCLLVLVQRATFNLAFVSQIKSNSNSSGACPAKSDKITSGVCPVTGKNRGSEHHGSTSNAEERSTDPQLSLSATWPSRLFSTNAADASPVPTSSARPVCRALRTAHMCGAELLI